MEMSIDKYMKPQQFKKLGRWGEEEIYKGGENGLDWNVPSTLFPTNLCLSCLRTIWKRGRATVWKRGRATTNHLEERKGNYEPFGREEGQLRTTWRERKGNHLEERKGNHWKHVFDTFSNKISVCLVWKEKDLVYKTIYFQTTLPNYLVSKQLCQTI